MPGRNLTRRQLEGEMFLLTFPFIEPKGCEFELRSREPNIFTSRRELNSALSSASACNSGHSWQDIAPKRERRGGTDSLPAVTPMTATVRPADVTLLAAFDLADRPHIAQESRCG